MLVVCSPGTSLQFDGIAAFMGEAVNNLGCLVMCGKARGM